MADELVWMRHTEHHGVARFPEAAAEAWQALGWAPCDPPVEQDPALVEHVPMAVALARQAEAEQSTSDTEDTNSSKSEEE